MTKRSVSHAKFVLERTYDARPSRVFDAFAKKEYKKLWFGGPPEWGPDVGDMDFRVGGRETSRGGPPGGPVSSFEALYYDIVPNERIVYSYEMHLDDKKISVSLATIEFKAEAGGTRLVMTEQGAYLDGYDDANQREMGTKWLLDQLGESLKKVP